MVINVKNENGKITIAPEGWLDIVSAPELGDAIGTITEMQELVLDLDMVEYMASAGLRQIVAAHRRAKELGAAFSVINARPEIVSIFKMTGIINKMNITAKE